MNHSLHCTCLILLGLAVNPAKAAETGTDCAARSDDAQRLACYDRLSGRQATPGPVAASTAVVPQALDANDAGRTPSVMSKVWELGAGDKRGKFVVRTYLPNFLLPVHYTTSINRSPSSPTQPAGAGNPDYRSVEAKLQISLRAKIAEDLFLPGADLWFTYTQKSLWQIWDQNDSAPFRSTDYQPEAIYVIPVPPAIGELPFGWNLRMLQVGFAHQSNGQSDPLSRSWNRIYTGIGLEHGDVGVSLRLNGRLPESKNDQNPDLTSYIGRGELAVNWFPGVSTLGLTWRSNFSNFNRGSLQLDMTHPVFADKPAGLRWYLQLFTGYGETLLDYNHRQSRIGLGLSLFQF